MTSLSYGPGYSPEEILNALEALRGGDVRWREGRAFSLAYNAGTEVLALAEEAYRRYSGENALNTSAFPSLREMQASVVDVVRRWVNGPDDASGFMTSGGTESLILAVWAAKQRSEREGRIKGPLNMVLPSSAHAALEKAAHYFGVESRRVAVGKDWRADVEAMIEAMDHSTVLVVASAPQYPQGVVDPISPLAAAAHERGINCHVDACMGGVTLPHLETVGVAFDDWDFRVEGVTSISVDLHKYGYTSKGAGVLIHRNRTLRNDQVFMTDNWLGGVYGSSGILGTKSGGPIASAWAVMHHLGDEGYVRLTRAARQATLQISQFVEQHPRLDLRAWPDTTLLSFGGDGVDIFSVADLLARRGWYVDRQSPPDSIHMTVNAVHLGLVTEFLADLEWAVDAAAGTEGTAIPYASVD